MKKTTLVGIVVLLVAVVGLGVYMNFVPPPMVEPRVVGEETPATSSPAQPPQNQTIVGYWECLPHKNTTGPQTMECAFGIAVDQSDGHFGIDTSLMSTYPVDFPTGTRVRVTGVVTPVNQLSSVQKYDIDGIIRATVIEKI
jgi:hypothetical protein